MDPSHDVDPRPLAALDDPVVDSGAALAFAPLHPEPRRRAILICGLPGAGKSTLLHAAAREAVDSGQAAAWVRPSWDTPDEGLPVYRVDTRGQLDALDLGAYDLVLMDHMEAILGLATVEDIDALAGRWRARVMLANERIPQRSRRRTAA